MREHPILFSGQMVRAILDGKKTQTRRIVKPQPIWTVEQDGNLYAGDHSCYVKVDGHPNWRSQFAFEAARWQPGDRLWVRETFHADVTQAEFEDMMHDGTGVYYRATEKHPEIFKWKPSLFMPRWASRITLEVVSVRVERLQDISEADAVAEGVKTSGVLRVFENPIMEYQHLWNTISGEGAWDANPWVWVVEFKRIER